MGTQVHIVTFSEYCSTDPWDDMFEDTRAKEIKEEKIYGDED